MELAVIDKPKSISTSGCAICTYWNKYDEYNPPLIEADINLSKSADGTYMHSSWGRCSNAMINKSYRMWMENITRDNLVVRIIKDEPINKSIVSTSETYGCQLCRPE